MPDIFDEIAAEVSGGGAAVAPSAPVAAARQPDIFDQIAAEVHQAPRPLSAGEGVAGGMQKILSGLTFGLGDEISAGGNALIDSVMNGGTVSQNYDARLAQARELDAAVTAQAPEESMVLSGLSGFLTPVPKALTTAATTKGVIPAVKTIGGAALVGGAYGGAAGFGYGEGGLENRLGGAAEGATIGTIGGGALAGAGVGASKVVNEVADFAARQGYTADHLTDAVRYLAASERGAVGEGGPEIAQKLSPESLLLVKQLKNVPVAKLEEAANQMRQAQALNAPLFLPEALDSAKVTRNARFIASHEASMDMAKTAIDARTAAAPERATAIFDAISPVRSQFEGAGKMVGAADDILEAANAKRLAETGPLYQAVYRDNPTVISSELSDLVSKDKAIQKALREVKKTAVNAELPDNSTVLLVKVRSEVGDDITKAQANGRTREARDLTDTYNRLNDQLKKVPGLAEADFQYAARSVGVDNLRESFISNLSKITADKVQNVGQVLSLPAERITELRNVFAGAGKLDEWNAGIRSHLQNLVESTPEGTNFSRKIIGDNLKDSRLRAALGSSYDDVSKALGFEDKMFKGKNSYHPGSSTVGNLNEGEAFQQDMSLLGKIRGGKYMDVLLDVLQPKMADEAAQGLGRIYFDPIAGTKALDDVAPILRQYATNSKVAGELSQAATIAGLNTGRAGADEGGSISPQALAYLGLGSGLALGASPALGLLPSQALPPSSLQAPQSATQSSEGRQYSATQESATRSSGQGMKGSSKGAESPSTQTPGRTTQNQGQSSQSSGKSAPPSSATQDLFGGVFKPTSYQPPSVMTEVFKGKKMDSKDVKKVEAEIDKDPYLSALYEAESGRNPEAKNPESSASGGFQFVKKTAKAIGLADPFNLAESLDAVRKLRDADVKRFGDNPAALYSAHYLGATVFNKYLDGEKLTEKEMDQVRYLKEKALPRFMSIYKKVANKQVGA